MNASRLEQQVRFSIEIDKLKGVDRQTLLTDGSRRENSVEHSWHIAVMASLLREYSRSPDLDVERVVRMVLIHDIVEIDAGDTYCYDEKTGRDRPERERKAADRIFALLPPDQEREFRGLWEEFEEGRTAESQFAAALDRLQPVIHNYCTGGRMWRENSITRPQVMNRISPVKEAAPLLWEFVSTLIDDAVAKGFLSP
ncbi:MAG: HD domain-containing protein [Deltaproteobacteria bacterium]|nr:HD domain-containing protein [Deltaproteobacteria bacterium]